MYNNKLLKFIQAVTAKGHPKFTVIENERKKKAFRLYAVVIHKNQSLEVSKYMQSRFQMSGRPQNSFPGDPGG